MSTSPTTTRGAWLAALLMIALVVAALAAITVRNNETYEIARATAHAYIESQVATMQATLAAP